MTKQNHNATGIDTHQSAFEVYWNLGPKRSYRQVAAQLGVSVGTVKNWSRRQEWRRRLADRETETARQAADQAIGSAVTDVSRKRKMVELALLKVIKAINSGQVRIQLGDLDRLLRLQSFLDGDHRPVTPEILRQHPPEEVAQALWDWFFQLDEYDRSVVIRTLKSNETPPTASRSARPVSPSEKGQNPGDGGTKRDNPDRGSVDGHNQQ